VLFEDGLPIIACSSGPTSQAAGVALLRLSGFSSLDCLSKFFPKNSKTLEPRVSSLRKIVFNGEVFDEVLATYFSAPHSFTGENVLELGVHGNPFNIRRILDLFCKEAGFRLALPGEFSFRALRNKKITLTQAEGLELLMAATSPQALAQGLSALGGELHENFLNLRESFLFLRSSLELMIDFSEDVGEEQGREIFLKHLKEFSLMVDGLAKRSRITPSDLLSPTIALFGLPNAGKSTLFNFLLGAERSIVTPIAGTTRDYVSEDIVWDGIQFKLIDTAGVHASSDVIESEGIKRAIKIAERAFLRVLVIDATDFSRENELLKGVSADIVLFTHCDQQFSKTDILAKLREISPSAFALLQMTGPIGPTLYTGPIGPDAPMGATRFLLNGTEILSFAASKYREAMERDPLLVDRQRRALLLLAEELSDFNELVSMESDIAIISHEISKLDNIISQLIGITLVDDVYNLLFSRFCIGK
jgi:tRNA modification GTPase